MKKFYLCLSFCSLSILHGCFDNSQNNTKDNTDGSNLCSNAGGKDR